MLVAANVLWRCTSQLSPSTGVTTCADPHADSAKRKRPTNAYGPVLDFLFLVLSILVLLSLIVPRRLFVRGTPSTLRDGRPSAQWYSLEEQPISTKEPLRGSASAGSAGVKSDSVSYQVALWHKTLSRREGSRGRVAFAPCRLQRRPPTRAEKNMRQNALAHRAAKRSGGEKKDRSVAHRRALLRGYVL